MTRKSSLKYWTSQRITQNIQYWYSEEDSEEIQNKKGKRAREREGEGLGENHQQKWKSGERGTVGSFISQKEKNKEMKLGEVPLLLWCKMSPNRHFGTAEAGNKTVKLNWFVWKLSGALNPPESPLDSCVWILMKAVNLLLHCKGAQSHCLFHETFTEHKPVEICITPVLHMVYFQYVCSTEAGHTHYAFK